MNKNELIQRHGYIEIKLETDKQTGIPVDTIYKKFDNGNVRIVQYGSEMYPDGVREVFLTGDQIYQIFN